ncbi:MAG: hypothetical protein KJI71_00825 [Patescibacteria group bacterium]|nr:hypothetical protein [Patescibacteria group bacterium]
MSAISKKINNPELNKYIASNNILRAKDFLLKLILEDNDFSKSTDSWSFYANKISVKLHNIKTKIDFWIKLGKTIEEAEISQKQSIYWGVVYWKLATLDLVDGEEFPKVIQLLEQSYEQDLEYQKKDPSNFRSIKLAEHKAKGMAAFRLKNFLSLIIDDVNNAYAVHPEFRIIRGFLSNRKDRRIINQIIVQAFDLHIEDPNFFNTLPWEPFDRLLRRNPYRVHIQSFYNAAGWLVGKRQELEKNSLEKYGVSYAIMLLAGTLIEGVLFNLPKVRREVSRERVKKPTLGYLTHLYFKVYRRRLSKEIGFFLCVINYIRNKIHPSDFDKNIDRRININFASFVYRLAERCIILLAIRHTRKNPYKQT